jgi:uncharacterized membrane protein
MEDGYREADTAADFGDIPPASTKNDGTYGFERTHTQRLADFVAVTVGSWPFIAIQSILLIIWITVNVVLVMKHSDKAWDPYPFIFLNLVLSCQSAYTGPIVMMSQNRQAEKDRRQASRDYETNIKAESEIRAIMDQLRAQDRLIRELIIEVQQLRQAGHSEPRSPHSLGG